MPILIQEAEPEVATVTSSQARADTAGLSTKMVQKLGSSIQFLTSHLYLGFPGGASGKEPTCQRRRCKGLRFKSGLGRSPGGGHSNQLQYSCLENLMDIGA